MSALSDKYERDVAKYITQQIRAVKASRPSVGSNFSDVKIEYKGVTSWLEVKMNHNDRLVSSRVFYKDGQWGTTYPTNVATEAVKLLNKSNQTKKFISNLKAFLGNRQLKKPIDVKNLSLSTTSVGMKEKNAVHMDDLMAYFDQSIVLNKYIMVVDNYDVGASVTAHFTNHKASPAYYMQTGDDFLKMTDTDPFNLDPDKDKIPLLSGKDKFKVRVAKAGQFYEIVTELKILKMPSSKYSLKPGTKKLNPFLK